MASDKVPSGLMDRIAPARRPEGPPQGYQKWRSLLFTHWEVSPEALRAHVPEPLGIDVFEGRAYVGLVAFAMRDVQPSRFLPPPPTFGRFLELNLRTYVHLGGRDPGVWFFSLDASSSLAVLGARAVWHLPYFRARMEMDVSDRSRAVYRSERRWPQPAKASLDVRYEIGDPLAPAEPGSFEHFLVERYYLYAAPRPGDLRIGQVHHRPYPIRRARVLSMEESIVSAAGIARPEKLASELWSDGVDVEIFGLRKIRGRP
jgi:uncharacterized protein YqjF (DUF2071 family)